MPPKLIQSFSPLQIVVVMAMGVACGSIATLQPILLGGLVTRGNINLNEMGYAATFESLGTALSITLCASLLKPVGLKRIVFVAFTLALVCNLITPLTHGMDALVIRGINGLCSGTIMWVLVGFLARTSSSGRSFAIYVTASASTSFVFSLIIGQWLAAYTDGSGGYWLFALLDFFLILTVVNIPDAYHFINSSKSSNIPPLKGLLGLLSCGFFIACIMSFWVYVKPLGKELGYASDSINTAISLAIAMQIAAGIFSAILSTRLKPAMVCLTASFIVMACIALFILRTHSLELYLSLMVFAFVWMFVPPFQLPMLIELDPSLRSVIYVGSAQVTGVAFGPLLAAQFLFNNTTLPTVKAAFILALLSIVLLISALAISHKEKAR